MSDAVLEIALFTTGGTIDGADSDRGSAPLTSSAEQWLIEQPNVNVTVHHLLNKDSRQITPEDRTTIAGAIATCPLNRILLTHGTFTIAETGRALRTALSNTKATILLVGSWIPFGDPGSDAPNQMQFALQVLGEGKPGIHIAMDGKLWDPALTEKREVGPGRFQLWERG